MSPGECGRPVDDGLRWNELREQFVRLISTVIDNLEGALGRQPHDEHGAD